jgi:MATE family multidrug resistance protein
VRLWGAPATLALFVLTGWFIGRGDGRSPLAIVLTVNLTNIALDFYLVWVAGMTADGVATATVTAEYLGVALGLALASRSLDGGLLRGSGAKFGYRRYLALNFPLFLRTTTLMLSFAFVTAMGARFGSVVLAANALLLNFLYFAAYALDGFANAAESLVGRAVGARDAPSLRNAIRLSARWTLGVAATLSTLFALAGWLAIDLLTSQPDLREAARDYLPWLVITPLVGCWAYLYDGVFVGAMLSRQMRDTMLFAALAVYLPAWYLLRPFGNHGLWLAFTLFLGARGVAQWWVLRRLDRSGRLMAA